LVDGASIIIYIQMLRKCEGGITVVLIVLLLISRSGNISIPYCPRFNLNNNKKTGYFWYIGQKYLEKRCLCDKNYILMMATRCFDRLPEK